MKDEHIDIDRMVMEAHYLDSLEREAEKSMDDMTREDYERQIQELRETVKSLQGIISIMKQTMDSLRASNDKNVEQMTSMQRVVEELTAELKKYQDYNGRHNRERFGKSSQKKSSTPQESTSRQEESDDYDNNHESPSGKEGAPKEQETKSTADSDKIDMTKVKSEALNAERGPRGRYTTMDAADVKSLETTLVGAPTNMKFCGYKTVDEYNKISYIQCLRFKIAIFEDEFGIRHEYYMPADPKDTRRPHINVVPGTSFSPEMAADLAVDRFMVMVPNHREAIRMNIDKFCSSHNTRLNAMKTVAKLLNPLYRRLKELVLAPDSILNIDETWTRVRVKFKGDKTKLGKYYKKYIWVIVNKLKNIAYFLYDNDENDSRGTRPIQVFLDDFEGTIQSDGYNVYKHLTKENPQLEHVLCWAHVRAKFVYAAEISKQAEAVLFIEDIGYLYAVEKEIMARHLTVDKIRMRRKQKDVKKTLDRLKKRALSMLADKHAHYSDMMLTALNYMVNGWDDLIRYREDGRYTIDNSIAERTIRPFTVSRNGSLHFSSEEGVEVAMLFHTIIETAKRCGLEVKTYLTRVISEIIHGNKDYDSLLPGNIAL